MDAAIVGAAIAALVAVLLFVVERTVARRAAFVERRRLAFDDVIQSFGVFISAAIETKGLPPADNAATLLSSRARMSLALGKNDRALNWWLTGMEKRLSAAAGMFATSPDEGLTRIDTLFSHVSNTLIDIHLGELNRHDLTIPAALFWVEAQSGAIPQELVEYEEVAERPRRQASNRGFAAMLTRSALWVSRPFRRRRANDWLPAWVEMEQK